MKVDHLTAVVADSEKAASALKRLLGAEFVGATSLPGMTINTLRVGDVELHVNAPTGPGPVRSHFERHGPSLHHLAFRVENLEVALLELRSEGFRTLGEPSETAPGLREVFVDPETTGGVLVQLVERAHDGVRPEDLVAGAVQGLAEKPREVP